MLALATTARHGPVLGGERGEGLTCHNSVSPGLQGTATDFRFLLKLPRKGEALAGAWLAKVWGGLGGPGRWGRVGEEGERGVHSLTSRSPEELQPRLELAQVRCHAVAAGWPA